MKKNKLIVVMVMGNIGTYKSHFINSLNKRPRRVFIIPDLNSNVHKDRIIENSIRDGNNVIIEGNYMKYSERELFIQTIKTLFQDTKLVFICYDFGPGDSNSLARRINSPGNLSAEKWENIHRTNQSDYSKPTKLEGFNRVITKRVIIN